ncbi:MAG: hypothetical protein ACRD1R_09475 [Acidobacteriota bacterium]
MARERAEAERALGLAEDAAAELGLALDRDKTAIRSVEEGFSFLGMSFFCEASFIEADRAQAERTGHLTARACGEIATAMAVVHLIPFHFSRRYDGEPERVYEEVRAACPRLVAPKEAAAFCA